MLAAFKDNLEVNRLYISEQLLIKIKLNWLNGATLGRETRDTVELWGHHRYL